MNQRGFATLEVILMIVVIGILASIAVPRFTDITTKANTAKIQADLSTIDTAIQIYIMDGGTVTSSTTVGDDIKPPTGQCYIGKKTPQAVPATTYTIQAASATDEARAICGTGNTAEKFYKGTSD